MNLFTKQKQTYIENKLTVTEGETHQEPGLNTCILLCLRQMTGTLPNIL